MQRDGKPVPYEWMTMNSPKFDGDSRASVRCFLENDCVVRRLRDPPHSNFPNCDRTIPSGAGQKRVHISCARLGRPPCGPNSNLPHCSLSDNRICYYYSPFFVNCQLFCKIGNFNIFLGEISQENHSLSLTGWQRYGTIQMKLSAPSGRIQQFKLQEDIGLWLK